MATTTTMPRKAAAIPPASAAPKSRFTHPSLSEAQGVLDPPPGEQAQTGTQHHEQQPAENGSHPTGAHDPFESGLGVGAQR